MPCFQRGNSIKALINYALTIRPCPNLLKHNPIFFRAYFPHTVLKENLKRLKVRSEIIQLKKLISFFRAFLDILSMPKPKYKN